MLGEGNITYKGDTGVRYYMLIDSHLDCGLWFCGSCVPVEFVVGHHYHKIHHQVLDSLSLPQFNNF